MLTDTSRSENVTNSATTYELTRSAGVTIRSVEPSTVEQACEMTCIPELHNHNVQHITAGPELFTSVSHLNPADTAAPAEESPSVSTPTLHTGVREEYLARERLFQKLAELSQDVKQELGYGVRELILDCQIAGVTCSSRYVSYLPVTTRWQIYKLALVSVARVKQSCSVSVLIDLWILLIVISTLILAYHSGRFSADIRYQYL